jgi:hypothetical protein
MSIGATTASTGAFTTVTATGDVTIGSAAVTSRMFRALEIGGAGNNAGIAFGNAGAKGAIWGASGTNGLVIVGGTGGPISFGYASGDASLYANYLSLGVWSTIGLGIGATPSAGQSLVIGKNITGATTSYGVFNNGTIQSDVTTNGIVYYSNPSTQAAAFTLTTLIGFSAGQGTIGAGSTVTNHYGLYSASTLTGASNNYGVFSNIAAPTSGITTTGTITSISSSTTTVTVNHNAITYTNGQTVTISATANATALVSGATCTILTVGTTDFTLIGAASNTVGVSFTASGAGTGTGTVTLNIQGSGKTVAGAASGSFTYTTTTSQTFTAVTVLTGSVTVSTRYNLYMAGTADNYIAGNVSIGTTLNENSYKAVILNDVAIRTTNDTTGVTNLRLGSSTSMPQGIATVSGTKTAGGAGYLTFGTATGGTVAEKMRIDESGNVGIGTTSPSTYGKLAVTGTTSMGVDQTDYANVLGASGTVRIETAGSSANPNLAFSTKGTGAVYFWRGGYGTTISAIIDGSGNVGIGTTSPTGKLDISATTNGQLMANVRNLSSGSSAYSAFMMGNDTNATAAFIGLNSSTNTFMGGTSALVIYNGLNTPISFGINTVEKMRIDSSGNVGIGATGLTQFSLRVSKAITGATTAAAIRSDGQVQSDVTSAAYPFQSTSALAAAVTTSSLYHYYAIPGAGGATSTVTNQAGFFAESTLGTQGAATVTNAYGFYGNLASGTNRWNLYMAGTADNYIAGNVGIGTSSPVSTSKLTVNGSISVNGSDTNFGAGGQRAVIDYTTNVARIGAVSGGVATGTAVAFYVGSNAGGGAEAARFDSVGSLNLSGSYTEGVVAIGNSGTAQTLSLASGTVQTVTMTGNCTFTMPTNVAGKSFILIVSSGSGGFTGTFTSVKWPNNTAPTLTTTATRWDILTFVANGTSWYGNFAQAYA